MQATLTSKGQLTLPAADFSDYCIANINQSRGASHTVTFDRKAAKFRLFKLLE